MFEQDDILRGSSFNEFLGQEDIKRQLSVAIKSSQARGELLQHCMISGSSGHGKSVLAKIIANETNTELLVVMCPTIKTIGNILEIFVKLRQDRDCTVFLDECHSLNPKLEETLYSILEEFKAGITIGNKTRFLDIKRFTCIGATTNLSAVSKPLRDRFNITCHMSKYTDSEIAQILKMNAARLKMQWDNDDVFDFLSSAARQTPRIANNLLFRVRDVAQLYNNNKINKNVVEKALEIECIDENGLNKLDMQYLSNMYSDFGGGPAGFISIASTLDCDKSYTSEIVEPYLIAKKLIFRGPSGRGLSADGLKLVLSKIAKV